MKRMISALLAACVLLGLLAGCAEKPQNIDQVLRERSIAMGQTLSAMTKDHSYRTLIGGGEGAISSKIDEIASGDFQTPRAVFAIEVKAQEIIAWLEEAEVLSQETKDLLSSRLVAMLPAQINGRAGADQLTVTSMMSVDHCFVEKGLAEPLLVISLYDTEWATAISYRPGEDGAIYAAATFLYDPALREVETAEQMQEWFSAQSLLQDISVRELG